MLLKIYSNFAMVISRKKKLLRFSKLMDPIVFYKLNRKLSCCDILQKYLGCHFTNFDTWHLTLTFSLILKENLPIAEFFSESGLHPLYGGANFEQVNEIYNYFTPIISPYDPYNDNIFQRRRVEPNFIRSKNLWFSAKWNKTAWIIQCSLYKK